MSFIDGLSQCWPLAQKCHVWWEAWAAGGTWASVAVALMAVFAAGVGVCVTAASALAVWRLGREANRLAHAPTLRAREEAVRERVVLLSAIYGELANVSSAMGAWNGTIRTVGMEQLFADKPARVVLARLMRDIDMPMTKSLIGRLHVLPEDESAALARCLGLISVLHMAMGTLERYDEGFEAMKSFVEDRMEDARTLDELAQTLVEKSKKVVYAKGR